MHVFVRLLKFLLYRLFRKSMETISLSAVRILNIFMFDFFEHIWLYLIKTKWNGHIDQNSGFFQTWIFPNCLYLSLESWQHFCAQLHQVIPIKSSHGHSQFWCCMLIRNLLQGYNRFHNILRLFDVLPNFPFTTSETIITYKHGIYELPNDLGLTILGN